MRALVFMTVLMFSSFSFAQTSGEHSIDQIRSSADSFWKYKEVDKLTNESEIEQDKIFKQHGVPQNIIDGFLKG